jgi:hypothetical protein
MDDLSGTDYEEIQFEAVLAAQLLVQGETWSLWDEDDAANDIADLANWDASRIQACPLLLDLAVNSDVLDDRYLDLPPQVLSLAGQLLHLSAELAEDAQLRGRLARRAWGLWTGESPPRRSWGTNRSTEGDLFVPSNWTVRRLSELLSHRGWATRILTPAPLSEAAANVEIVIEADSELADRWKVIRIELWQFGGSVTKCGARIYLDGDPRSEISAQAKALLEERWNEADPLDRPPVIADGVAGPCRTLRRLVVAVSDEVNRFLEVDALALPPEIEWRALDQL